MKGKNMEMTIEPGLNNPETNLEGGVGKEAGLSPERKLEKENMPHVDSLVEKIKKEAIKEVENDPIKIPEEWKESFVVSKMIEMANRKEEDMMKSYKEEESLKAVAEVFLSRILSARVNELVENYKLAHFDYNRAGFPELAKNMEKKIIKETNKEDFARLEEIEKLSGMESDTIKDVKENREELEVITGSLFDLTNEEVEKLDQERIDFSVSDKKQFKNIIQSTIDLQQFQNRFAGLNSNLSEAEKDHKQKVREAHKK